IKQLFICTILSMINEYIFVAVLGNIFPNSSFDGLCIVVSVDESTIVVSVFDLSSSNDSAIVASVFDLSSSDESAIVESSEDGSLGRPSLSTISPPGISSPGVSSGSALSSSLGFLKIRSEEHTFELQSRFDLVCRLLLEKTHLQ